MSLRQPSTPRTSIPSSNLPAPGSTPSALSTRRKSAIPLTPGGFSSARNAGTPVEELDSLKAAVLHHHPNRYTNGEEDMTDSPTPAGAVGVAVTTEEALTRPPKLNGMRKPSLHNLRAARPTTPSSAYSSPGVSTPKTPSRPPMPPARTKTPSRLGNRSVLEIGDAVKIEVAGETMEGTLRFVGEVDGKAGEFGGVELDAAWAGKGKNDGSVKGTQYFACAPHCGLFLQLSKIIAKDPPTLTASSSRPASSLSGSVASRASRLANTSAKELAAAKRMPPPASPTKTPRRSISPEKPSSLAGSTMATPRPRARPSIGSAVATPGFGIPSRTPRKSLGPATPTPRPAANLSSSLKRPPSSLRNHVASTPDVPPIPASFAGRSSVTPSGRGTPVTTGGHSRRMSVATDTSMSSLARSEGRPTTPSFVPGRSLSRQSFASSTLSHSRQSQRSDYSNTADEGLKEELREAKDRQVELQKLLEGSESLGRDMETKLSERERELHAVQEQVALLEQEREREKAREVERVRAAGDEAAEAERVLALEAKVDELIRAEASSKAAVERQAREWDTKFAAKENEIESLKERMTSAAADAEDERNDLNSQLDKLRGAGQALCETYEERIAGIELGRLEALEVAEELQERLSQMSGTSDVASPTLSHSHGSSAADAINLENAKAELDHMRTKMGNLEEQLEETRMHLEAEVAETKRRRQKTAEIEMMLKKENKAHKDTIDRLNKTEGRLSTRIEELEAALVESQTALENERSEVEHLRHDANSSSSNDDSAKLIATIKSERDAARREASKNADLIAELRDDLRAAEGELDRFHQSPVSHRKGSAVSVTDSDGTPSIRGKTSTPIQQTSQDTPNLFVSPSNRNRDSIASSASRRSTGGKDEATATREQIVGLKVIIETLTEENKELIDRNKSLMVEAQQLKDAQRELETSFANLVSKVDTDSSPVSLAASERRPSSSALNNAPLQREVDELKAKLAAAEKKSAKEIQALNQEVTDLEAIVESKMFKEEELENEVAKLKLMGGGHANGNGHHKKMVDEDDDACEMCGSTLHSIEKCPDFSAATPKSASFFASRGECEDCGGDHALEDCPLASEIF